MPENGVTVVTVITQLRPPDNTPDDFATGGEGRDPTGCGLVSPESS
jgi:hypothetical protein